MGATNFQSYTTSLSFSFCPACILKENTPSYWLPKYKFAKEGGGQVAEPNLELNFTPQGMSRFCVPPLFRACASVQRAQLCPLVSLRSAVSELSLVTSECWSRRSARRPRSLLRSPASTVALIKTFPPRKLTLLKLIDALQTCHSEGRVSHQMIVISQI